MPNTGAFKTSGEASSFRLPGQSGGSQMVGEFLNQKQGYLISSSVDDDLDDYQERMEIQKMGTG